MQTPRCNRIAACSLGALLLTLPLWTFGQAGPAPSALECMQLALVEAPATQPVSGVETRRSADDQALPRDPACWIEFDDVSAWSGGQPAWVDVRSTAQTRNMKLAGALEIPLTDLPRKTFLRPLPIVLIGTGYDDVELSKTCAELHRIGFQQVKLLRGGVRAWQQAGRPPATGSVDVALQSISPGDFHRSVAGAPWLLLGPGVAGDEVLPPKFAHLRRLDTGADTTRGMAAIAQARNEVALLPALTRPTLIVVVAPDVATAQQLQEAGRRARLPDVLFLDGGLAGYRKFLVEQESMSANAGKPLVRPCGSG